MILYFDTSILVKKYVQEEYSDELPELLAGAETVAISDVGYAEAVAAFARKYREKAFTRKTLDALVADLRDDWDRMLHVIVSDEVHAAAEKLILKHGLRGFDAIHLASAVVLKKHLKRQIAFCCTDKRLLRAADKERLDSFPR